MSLWLHFSLLGEFLVGKIKESTDFQLAFVWNRNSEKAKETVDPSFVIDELTEVSNRFVYVSGNILLNQRLWTCYF